MSCTAAEGTRECTSTILLISGRLSVLSLDSSLMVCGERTGAERIPSKITLFAHHQHHIVQAAVSNPEADHRIAEA